jgi:hypothetical protein
MSRRRYKKRNPLKSNEDLIIAGVGVLVAAGVGYAIYSKTTASTAAAAANPLINPPLSPASTASVAGTNAGIAAAQGQTTYGNTGDN